MTGARFPALANSPILLLAICGFLFASKIMLTKAALDAGAQVFQLVFVVNSGAGLFLLALVIWTRQPIPLRRAHIALYVGLGLLSFAAPALLSNAVVDRVGPAYTSTVYSLSPLLTMTFASGLGIERMTINRLTGITLGFGGMLVLVHQQIALIDVGQTAWVIVGLLIPASAALGNIVRTAYWPKGTSALAFSCATLLTSSIMVAIAATYFETPAEWQFDNERAGKWMACSVVLSALSYVLNFHLQRVAGPVIFSQIGYWGAGYGILLAALLFGDVLTVSSIFGITGIMCGGVLASHRGSLVLSRSGRRSSTHDSTH
jgi:drug/metabolite transporter (DMT)-like permease